MCIHILSRLITAEIDLDHLANMMFIKLLHCKVVLIYSLSILYIWEGNPYASPILK